MVGNMSTKSLRINDRVMNDLKAIADEHGTNIGDALSTLVGNEKYKLANVDRDDARISVVTIDLDKGLVTYNRANGEIESGFYSATLVHGADGNVGLADYLLNDPRLLVGSADPYMSQSDAVDSDY